MRQQAQSPRMKGSGCAEMIHEVFAAGSAPWYDAVCLQRIDRSQRELNPMVRKIFKTGNSMVVSLPKEVLDSLHLGEGAEVDVAFDQARGVITIVPVQVAVKGVDEDFARQVSAFIEQYRPALEALAKA